jgi:hypothetical protein
VWERFGPIWAKKEREGAGGLEEEKRVLGRGEEIIFLFQKLI